MSKLLYQQANDNFSQEGTLQSNILNRLIKRQGHAVSNLKMRKANFDNVQKLNMSNFPSTYGYSNNQTARDLKDSQNNGLDDQSSPGRFPSTFINSKTTNTAQMSLEGGFKYQNITIENSVKISRKAVSNIRDEKRLKKFNQNFNQSINNQQNLAMKIQNDDIRASLQQDQEMRNVQNENIVNQKDKIVDPYSSFDDSSVVIKNKKQLPNTHIIPKNLESKQ
eukprot:403343871